MDKLYFTGFTVTVYKHLYLPKYEKTYFKMNKYTFPPIFMPSVTEYRAGGGLGAAWAE